MNFYKYADLKIDELNRLTIRRFEYAKRQLKKKNTSDVMASLYAMLDMQARQTMKSLAKQQYKAAQKELGEELDEIEDLFVDNILSNPNSVTLYTYETEVYRKRDRAVEGLNATKNSYNELKKAMRLWAQMTNQYIDVVAFDATVKAYKDAGIKYVKWVSQKDEKVCQECDKRDGRRFPIDALPPRHWRCRCYFI